MRPMALRIASDKVCPMSLRWAKPRPLTSTGSLFISRIREPLNR